MDNEVITYLKQNPDIAEFVRYHPIWYRYLMRDPNRLTELKKEAKKFYGKTFPQKVNNFSNQLQMVRMFAEMAKSMKD
ncbi:YlbE-like family protein [Oceanobacillus sp. FSL K6-3682]|uniref:YlbE-like family protein n=1 Tax=Oceanobacillus sp. FSL K6-3682 TaxID=2921503 RepID=UPI0030D762DA